ncbi:MAG: hypothetical protein DRJ42_14270 [Deltaproteobacteria bacterium]|nr:MAG: hypothetical protein DRJ42_14270 [Deltaproteobacteria bacterium]
MGPGTLAVALLLMGGAGVARAQTINEREGPLSFQNQVRPGDDPVWSGRGEMSLWTAVFVSKPAGGNLVSLSPVGRGHYDIADGWGGHFVIPLSYVDVSAPMDPGTTLIRFANLTLGAHKRLRHEATSGTVAFDIALPTGWVPNDVDPDQQSAMRLAFATSAATHGNRRLWLWSPERLSLVLRGTVSHRVAGAFDVFGEAAVAPMIPVGDEGTDTHLFVEGTVGGAWVVPELLRLGIGLSVAYLSSGMPAGSEDPVQTSLQLFGRIWLDNLFLALAFTMNLDEPAGFAFSDGGVWGVHFGVGSRF